MFNYVKVVLVLALTLAAGAASAHPEDVVSAPSETVSADPIFVPEAQRAPKLSASEIANALHITQG